MKTVVIGAGSDLGVQINVASRGPKQLIKDMSTVYQGESVAITQNNAIIKNRNLAEKRKNEQDVNTFNSALYKIVDEKMKAGFLPVIIGGDHSISIATALASQKNYNNTGIIWFDAHTDYNTYDTTPTGNIHGMVLSTITGYKQEELRGFYQGPTVNPFKAVVVGARSIDQREMDNIKYVNLNVLSTDDIKTKGLKTVVEEAFKIASENTQKIHISFDLDLIDPTVASGVSVPEENGISETEAMQIIDIVLTHVKQISAIDVVEFNSNRDPERKTEQIALNIIAKIVNTIDNLPEEE